MSTPVTKATLELLYKDKASKGVKNTEAQFNSSFNSMKSSATAFLSGLAIMEIAKRTVELADLGAKAKVVRRSFNQLAEEPDKMLTAMKEAVAGTISEMELMQQYNSAALLGLPLERFDEMLMIARSASQATGQSMDFMLNSIVVALGRGSKLMLDNLGILFDGTRANEEYAESIGKTASQLDDEERKLAFINKGLEVGIANIEKMGGVQDAEADKFARYTANFKNATVALGEAVLPVVGKIMEGLGLSMEAWANILSGAPGSDWWEGVANAMSNARTETSKLSAQAGGIQRLIEEIEAGKIGSLQWGDALESLGMDLGKLGETKKTVIPALQNMLRLIDGSLGPLKQLHDEEMVALEKQLRATAYSMEELNEEVEALDDNLDISNLRGYLTEFKDLPKPVKESVNYLDAVIPITDQFASSLAQAAIYGQDMGDAVVSSLRAIAAQLLSKAAVYGLLNIFTGGGAGAAVGGVSFLQYLFGFDSGGFTGYGGEYEPAGIVHRGEDVWSQDDIRRWGGVDVVERMRQNGPGYAQGGVVGGGSAGINGVLEIRLKGELKDMIEVSIAPVLDDLATRNQIKLAVR